jgi:TonB family protein
MKKNLIFISLLINIALYGQNPPPKNWKVQEVNKKSGENSIQQKDTTDPEIYTVVEQMAQYPGGTGEMMKYIQKNIHYPAKERDAGIEGKCFIKFVVEMNGSISNVEVLKGVPNGSGCDNEAVRVIKSMPNWIPGTQNGQRVRVYFNVPIIFRLTSNQQVATKDSLNDGKSTSKTEQSKYKDSLNEVIAQYTKAIELNPNNAVAYNNRGYIKEQLKNYQGAIEDYNKTIALDPKNAFAYNNRGYSKHLLGNDKEAIEDYNMSIELNPNNDWAYFYRGETNYKLNNYAGARFDFTKAIELNPKDARSYNGRGLIESESKNDNAAVVDYNKAIELNPKLAIAYFNRGYSKSALQNDNGAIEDYTKALELDSSITYAYLNRGNCKRRLKDYENAINDYNKLIQSNPQGIAHVYYYRGLAKFELGDRNGACIDWVKADQSGNGDAKNFLSKYCK